MGESPIAWPKLTKTAYFAIETFGRTSLGKIAVFFVARIFSVRHVAICLTEKIATRQGSVIFLAHIYIIFYTYRMILLYYDWGCGRVHSGGLCEYEN